MIYGPITPRTADALSVVVVDNPEAIESGMRLVASSLQVGAGIAIDHLGVDAARVPLLVFVADPGADRGVPVRVAEALSWFDDCGVALHPLLQQHGAVVDGDVRAVVIGFELSSLAAERLRGLGDPRVTVVQLEPYQIGPEQRLGRFQVLPESDDSSAVGFPATLVPGEGRDLADRLVDLLRRLDPDLTVGGDRYRRVLGGCCGPLVEVRRAGEAVEARVMQPEAEFVTLASEDQVHEIVDDATRLLLSSMRRSEAVAAGPALAADSGVSAEADDLDGAGSRSEVEASGGLRERGGFTSARDLGRGRLARRTVDDSDR